MYVTIMQLISFTCQNVRHAHCIYECPNILHAVVGFKGSATPHSSFPRKKNGLNRLNYMNDRFIYFNKFGVYSFCMVFWLPDFCEKVSYWKFLIYWMGVKNKIHNKTTSCRIVNFVFTSMLGWNWPNGSGQEYKNLNSLQRQQQRQLTKTTMDTFRSEKLTWAFAKKAKKLKSLLCVCV